ncbi:MAG: hypothetical protein Q9168_004385, partial [Polycauliona sp. 1 TL-2023]
MDCANRGDSSSREGDPWGDSHGQINIAVPSRLRSSASSKLPLAAFRIGVKDNFDLEGTKTSLCSRSYLHTYPKKTESAPCIQTLLDLGVSIVGKTKLCAFAQWEEPTEAIEYTSPWSARADGYQSSGGSSNGSGAAVAAYDWLDIAIGSDTTGSILRPALWNGCFALRPTFGLLSTAGFVNCIKSVRGSPGHNASLQIPGISTHRASWVVTFSIVGTSLGLGMEFAQEIALALKLPFKQFSLSQSWQRCPPEDADHGPLEEYMLKATQDMWYDDYHAFDDFRDQHWAKFRKAPYLTPPTRAAWESGKTISKPDRDEAARKVHVFRSWFRAQFFDNYHRPLFFMPIENVGPRYRDEPP